MKKDKVIYTLGIFCFVYWFLDFINIVFFVKKPEYLLWYSTTGLLLTSLALIRRSPIFISIMFCALFVMESVWIIDFLGKIFFNNHIFGVTNYLFEPSYTRKDFIMSMYHLLLPPALLVALFRTKKVFRYSWVGSVVYASTLAFLTFFIVSPSEIVNCVHRLTRCRGFFSSIFTAVPQPFHIFVSIVSALLLIYLPTNYFLIKIGKRLKWKVL